MGYQRNSVQVPDLVGSKDIKIHPGSMQQGIKNPATMLGFMRLDCLPKAAPSNAQAPACYSQDNWRESSLRYMYAAMRRT